MVWYGTVRGTVRYGEWYGTVRYGTGDGTVRYGGRYGTVLGTVRYGTGNGTGRYGGRYGTVRYGMVWYGVKMFPTKTSRDVGMVDGISDATGSCMQKDNWWKIVQEQGGVFVTV